MWSVNSPAAAPSPARCMRPIQLSASARRRGRASRSNPCCGRGARREGSSAPGCGAGVPALCESCCQFVASRFFALRRSKEVHMPESVYKIITLVGTSTESWEKAAKAAVERAGKTLRDLRVAEIAELDMQLNNGKVEAYRAKVRVSFKFEGKD